MKEDGMVMRQRDEQPNKHTDTHTQIKNTQREGQRR